MIVESVFFIQLTIRQLIMILMKSTGVLYRDFPRKGTQIMINFFKCFDKLKLKQRITCKEAYGLILVKINVHAVFETNNLLC